MSRFKNPVAERSRIAFAAVIAASAAWARPGTTYSWTNTGTTGLLWSSPTNWSPATGVPTNGSGDSVVLAAGLGAASSLDDIFPLTIGSLDVSQFGSKFGWAGFFQWQPLTADTVKVGNTYNGSYVEGGATTINTALYVGYTTRGGSYEMRPFSSTTLTSPTEYVGYQGSAAFTQLGGANSATTVLYVGWNAVGGYTMQGGTLGSPTEAIGVNNVGTFTQSGGVNNPWDLQVGVSDSGTYTLSGGAGINTNRIELGVLDGSLGTFNQEAGIVNVTAASGLDGSVYIGEDVNASTDSVYNCVSGMLSAVNVNVGYRTGGTFNQTGATVSLSGNLTLGVNAGSFRGIYAISQDSVLSAANEYIGSGTDGRFDQTDSLTTNNITGTLELGVLSGTFGYYGFHGGMINAGSEIIGVAGHGFLIQEDSSCVNHDTGSLTLGAGSEYILKAGSLTVGGDEVLTDGGDAGFTQFRQDGGSSAVGGTIQIGTSGGGSVQFQLNGGSATAGNVVVNGGTFNQSGGSATIAGTLTMSNGGTYDLAGGTLTAPAVTLNQVNLGNKTQWQARIATGAIHLIVLQGDGILEADAGGQVLFDTSGGQNEIDAVVNNAGNVALVAGSDIQFSGTVNNNAGGIFDIQIDSGMAGSGTFNNSGGTLQKSGGTGTSMFSGLTLANSSTIDGQSGTLDLNVTGTNSGAINSEAGAIVKLGGTWALNDGSSFNGAGTTVAYGTLNVMGNVTAATDFQLAYGGVLQGSGYTFTSTNLLELQDGSSMSSPSSSTPLTVTSTGSMNVTGSPGLTTVVLNANGPTATRKNNIWLQLFASLDSFAAAGSQ